VALVSQSENNVHNSETAATGTSQFGD